MAKTKELRGKLTLDISSFRNSLRSAMSIVAANATAARSVFRGAFVIPASVISAPFRTAFAGVTGMARTAASQVKGIMGAVGIAGLIGGAIGGAVSLGGSIGAAANFETAGLQFETLLGSAQAAQKRLAELAKFGAETPFDLPEVLASSKVLQVFTKGVLASGKGLTLVGDIAAGTNQPFQDVAFWVGRMYDALSSGRPAGEAFFRLQEMGAISGDLRSKLEKMAEGGATDKMQGKLKSLAETAASGGKDIQELEDKLTYLQQSLDGASVKQQSGIERQVAQLQDKIASKRGDFTRTTEEINKLQTSMQGAGGNAGRIWEEFTKGTSQFSGGMKKLSGSFSGLMSNFRDTFGAIQRAFGFPIIDALKPVIAWAIANLSTLEGHARNLGTQIGAFITGVFESAKEGNLAQFLFGEEWGAKLNAAIEGVKEFFTLLQSGEGIQKLFEGAKEAMKTAGDYFIGGIKTGLDILGTTLATLFSGDTWSGFANTLVGAAQIFGGALLEAFQDPVIYFQTAIEHAVNQAVVAISKIYDYMSAAPRAVASVATLGLANIPKPSEVIKGQLPGMFENAEKSFDDILTERKAAGGTFLGYNPQELRNIGTSTLGRGGETLAAVGSNLSQEVMKNVQEYAPATYFREMPRVEKRWTAEEMSADLDSRAQATDDKALMDQLQSLKIMEGEMLNQSEQISLILKAVELGLTTSS